MNRPVRLGCIIIFFNLFSLIGPSMSIWAFTVTSAFGWRVHPVDKRMKFHTGIDISLKYGTRIPALFDGEAVWAAPKGGYGNTVILYHFNDTYTLYGHCAAIYVVLGQTVKAGETIALVGNSGVSTGPHLHLEYWVHNQYVDPMLIWKQSKQPCPTQ